MSKKRNLYLAHENAIERMKHGVTWFKNGIHQIIFMFYNDIWLVNDVHPVYASDIEVFAPQRVCASRISLYVKRQVSPLFLTQVQENTECETMIRG